jgi:hypothetical protein
VLAGDLRHLGIVDHSQRILQLPPKENIGGNRKLLHQIELLVDDADSGVFRVPGAMELSEAG